RKLLGKLFDHAEIFFDGKLIVTDETLEDTAAYGQNGRDSDTLYQNLLAIQGVEALVCIRQETEEQCTVGFRSREQVDVSVVASHFGGGGHKNASGLSMEGKIDTVIPQILKEFAKVL
ncbi:MAG: bifunctional oligoribonuclease/PAP phosphatase NrnA, partial [Spirochaetaceae bacterium]|nr:bifunctional oligoribonuclease/PAP phosphatase NrnA [Spirochaetaceae bacterium]